MECTLRRPILTVHMYCTLLSLKYTKIRKITALFPPKEPWKEPWKEPNTFQSSAIKIESSKIRCRMDHITRFPTYVSRVKQP